MNARDPEYDRFGPWVLEISEDDPPPPRFVPHLTRTEPALLSVKIPRLISRRDAHPGMDLYDYMVSLYEHDMIIWRRVEQDVSSETIRYGDVGFLHVTETLLRGNLHLATQRLAYDLPFNTVSRDVMDRVVDIIRARYQQAGEPIRDSVRAIVPTDLSFYFEGLLGRERETGSGMLPVASQADMAMRDQETSIWRRMMFGLVDKRLLESLHVCDGRELKIVGRGRLFAYRWQTVYGKDIRYVPVANIDTVEWLPDPQNRGVTKLVLQTSGGDCPYVFAQDNPTIESYRDTLRGLTAPRHR